MASRVANGDVVRALRAYDPDLSLLWSDRHRSWWFHWRGKPWWEYRHADGRVAQADVSVGEVLRIVAAADNRENGYERLDRFTRLCQQESSRRRAEMHRDDAEVSKEAEKMLRTAVSGPRPYVGYGRAACA